MEHNFDRQKFTGLSDKEFDKFVELSNKEGLTAADKNKFTRLLNKQSKVIVKSSFDDIWDVIVNI